MDRNADDLMVVWDCCIEINADEWAVVSVSALQGVSAAEYAGKTHHSM